MDRRVTMLNERLDHSPPPSLTGRRYGKSGQVAEQGLLILDLCGAIRYADDNSASVLGSSMQRLLGRHVTELIPALPLNPNGCGYNVAFVSFHFSGGQWCNFQATLSDGSSLDIGLSMVFLNWDGLSPIFLGRIHRLDHLPNATDDDFKRLQCALDESDEMAFITNSDGVIQYANRRFEAAGGYRPGTLSGLSLSNLGADVDTSHIFQAINSNIHLRHPAKLPLALHKGDGKPWYHEASIRPFLKDDEHLTHFVFTCKAVGKQQQKLNDLARLANHDYLTGLPNRRLFLDRLGQAIARAARRKGHFAVLYMDLDGFKEINDHEGHAKGDAALKRLGQLFATCVRDEDTMARIGGDEFACILADVTNPADAWKVCEKILAVSNQASADRCDGSQDTPAPGISIGVAIYPDDGSEEGALLHAADQAMYSAKRAGGNRWLSCPQKARHNQVEINPGP